MRSPLTLVLLVSAAFLTVACDEQRAARLEEGVSTEADVRREFGQPVQITQRPDGSKVLAYPRQPEGTTNYEIGIGPDGRMSSLRQLLTPANFARVQPGMDHAEVTRLLGRHANVARYAMKPGEEVWQWRFVQEGQAKKVFEVTFDSQHKVLSTATVDDARETLPAK
jgi:hypothetical protein